MPVPYIAILGAFRPLIAILTPGILRTDDAVNELYRLVGELTTSTVHDRIASLRWSWCLYRKITEMGSNTVLRTIYTLLLGLLKRKPEQIVSLAHHPTSAQIVARVRRVVEAIASGDIERAASASSYVIRDGNY